MKTEKMKLVSLSKQSTRFPILYIEYTLSTLEVKFTRKEKLQPRTNHQPFDLGERVVLAFVCFLE